MTHTAYNSHYKSCYESLVLGIKQAVGGMQQLAHRTTVT